MIAVGIDKNPKGGGGNSGNAFGQFQNFSKGVNNCVINTDTTLQPGDIVNKGWKDANTWWESAIYNGGDILNMANYTPLFESVMDFVCAVEEHGGSGTPPTASIVFQSENSVMCYSEANIRVNTTIPVKVNITGTFAPSGAYLDSGRLTGTNKIVNDVVDQIITGLTTYNFGIDGANIGGSLSNSSIAIEISDATTNVVIDTYIFNRLHAAINC